MNNKLILLYGKSSNETNGKQQMLIDEQATCGYREYAQKFGCIIYLTPVKIRKEWEYSMNLDQALKFISERPDDIVWSVKYDPTRDEKILSKIKNKKMYYSCNSKNLYNSYCDISLVDTEQRMGKNSKLYVKGKDPDIWFPDEGVKEFDYLLMGKRGDKNELYFLQKLNSIKDRRRILWIGGKKFKGKIKTNHEVIYISFCGSTDVRKNISKAKVGILFTEHPAEGFPQSFLEMTMCGVPVVYNKHAPRNKHYFHPENSLLVSKDNLVNGAEELLKTYNSEKCRNVAIENYSLSKSYERMISCIK